MPGEMKRQGLAKAICYVVKVNSAPRKERLVYDFKNQP